jgi:hypothetical protein
VAQTRNEEHHCERDERKVTHHVLLLSETPGLYARMRQNSDFMARLLTAIATRFPFYHSIST